MTKEYRKRRNTKPISPIRALLLENLELRELFAADLKLGGDNVSSLQDTDQANEIRSSGQSNTVSYSTSVATSGTAFTLPELVARHGGPFAAGQTDYADVNGDGLADMIFQGTDNQFWLSKSNGTGFDTPQFVMKHGGPFAAGQTDYADVNGDGLADMIFQGGDNRFWLSKSNGVGFDPPRFVIKHGGPFAAGQTDYADINGDKRADMIFQGTDNRFWLSLSNGNGFDRPTYIMQHGGSFSAGQTDYADVNGDGLADMIFQGTDNRFWLSKSNGTGFDTPQFVMKHGGPFVAGQTDYADVNGDGLADMIFQGTDNRFWLSLSDGKRFQSPDFVMQHGGPFAAGQTSYADVTGDGRADMIYQASSNMFWLSKGINSLPTVISRNDSDQHLNAVWAASAWNHGFTGRGVTVAIVDSGVDSGHFEFGHRIRGGFDFVDNDFSPADANGHGTHVAGIVAANRDQYGMTGIAYEANILPVRVLNSQGTGSSASVIRGIRYAVDQGARIINLSLGHDGDATLAERDAIAYAASRNVLIVASAGNRGREVGTPQAWAKLSREFSNILSIGNFDTLSRSINPSSQAVGVSGAVQVDAPGTSVVSTLPGHRFGPSTGTSMSAPFVSGLAALALSANPSMSATDLRSAIVYGANQPIIGSDSMGGINAALTLAIAANSKGGGGSRVGVLSSPSSNILDQSSAAFGMINEYSSVNFTHESETPAYGICPISQAASMQNSNSHHPICAFDNVTMEVHSVLSSLHLETTDLAPRTEILKSLESGSEETCFLVEKKDTCESLLGEFDVFFRDFEAESWIG